MKVAIVFDDWRLGGCSHKSGYYPGASIYATELGQCLSEGQLHSGTVGAVAMGDTA